MRGVDFVYGDFEIKEEILLELINCSSLQRLKGVDQAGYKPLWKKFMKTCGYEASRFAHSLGVCVLLRKYKAGLEEQVAGLIHDVSHSAFSHCIDYTLDEGSEIESNHQDKIFEDFVRDTEIPTILSRYGFDLEYILNERNFPLKERELPDICADRIDYSLRTAIIFEEISRERLNFLLENLIVQDKYWVFKDFESAIEYALLFKRLNQDYFAGFRAAHMLKSVGEYLKYALKKGYIERVDLYTSDEEVLKCININLDKDDKLKLLWERMNNRNRCRNNSDEYDVEVFCKSRVVDPLCIFNKEIKRVSDIDSNWKEVVLEESKPKKYFLRFDD